MMRLISRHSAAVIILLLPLTSLPQAAAGGSLRFQKSEPARYDFADQRALPPTFGAGEFTLELWVKPDTTSPVGPTDRGTFDQLANWSELDPRPYSSSFWWLAGNWLLDGHSRPQGFDAGDPRDGTFSLQFYGGGRLRWMFADDPEVVPLGKVWAVQAYPARTTPSLLDGKWHQVTCVRRWVEETKADLELWIDGKLVARQRIPQRVNMRKYWDSPPHPTNPKELGGWCWGSEVMTAWNYVFTQYEDYKGLLDELRFWDRAKSPEEIGAGWESPVKGDEKGLVGYFPMDEGSGELLLDKLDQKRTMRLHRANQQSWSPEGAPLKANAAGR